MFRKMAPVINQAHMIYLIWLELLDTACCLSVSILSLSPTHKTWPVLVHLAPTEPCLRGPTSS